MKFLASVCILAICATLAPATHPVARVVQHQQCYQQQYHAQQYVAPIAYIEVPSYYVGASPEAFFNRGRDREQPEKAAVDPVLAELLKVVTALQADVAAIKRGGPSQPKGPDLEPLPPLPVKQAREHPGTKVMQLRCASCHDETTKAKGGGNAFFRAGVFLDKPEDVDRIAVAVDSGMMGKDTPLPKLSDGEKYAVLSFLLIREATKPTEKK